MNTFQWIINSTWITYAIFSSCFFQNAAAADDTHTGEQMRYLTVEDHHHASSANLDGSRDYHNSSMDAEKISRDFGEYWSFERKVSAENACAAWWLIEIKKLFGAA